MTQATEIPENVQAIQRLEAILRKYNLGDWAVLDSTRFLNTHTGVIVKAVKDYTETILNVPNQVSVEIDSSVFDVMIRITNATYDHAKRFGGHIVPAICSQCGSSVTLKEVTHIEHLKRLAEEQAKDSPGKADFHGPFGRID